MKKLIPLFLVLVCILVCVLVIVAYNSNKHICRELTYEESLDFSFQPASSDEPFITDEERDALLSKAIKKYLDRFNKETPSFTYEMVGSDLGVYEGKETLLCWVKIVYGGGFTTVMGFIIQ